jgi:hypothetical protein
MTIKEYLSDATRVERSRATMRALIAVAELAPDPVPDPALTFLAAGVELLRHGGTSSDTIRAILNQILENMDVVLAELNKPALQVVK